MKCQLISMEVPKSNVPVVVVSIQQLINSSSENRNLSAITVSHLVQLEPVFVSFLFAEKEVRSSHHIRLWCEVCDFGRIICQQDRIAKQCSWSLILVSLVCGRKRCRTSHVRRFLFAYKNWCHQCYQAKTAKCWTCNLVTTTAELMRTWSNRSLRTYLNRCDFGRIICQQDRIAKQCSQKPILVVLK